jgi:D-apiose dehydrogenase
MMNKLKGAVVGCGMISEFHLKAWKRLEEVEITTLVSRNIENAQIRQEEFVPQARIYQDFEEALQTEPLDFVDILTPPAVHKAYCLLAQKHGVHIICQKPIAEKIEEARELVDMMEGYEKLFAIHENHRYRPWFQEIQMKFKEGFFGKPRFIRVEQHNPSEPGVAYKLEMEKGVLLEHGTHLVDMVYALMGQPKSIYARLHHVSAKIRGESLAHVVFDYPETTAVIDVAWKPGGVQQAGFLLEGEEGEAYFQGSLVKGGDSRLRLSQGKQVVEDQVRNSTGDYEESFFLFQRECVDAILAGQPEKVIQTGRYNLGSLEITFAAYEAAQRNTVLNIENQGDK